ncbi:MAG TPA: penicillin-binding protein [Marinilabiliaceae bacterium]|nr:penicillin-binding protein [Marinilabiliaceae bacterium]HBX88262.1 penicillin-binding protein [Marinilabiliaceae bacterium]
MVQWKKYFDKYLLKHLGIILGSAILLIIAIFFFLRVYTLHGEGSPVPDFRGLTEQQLQHLVKERKLRYTISDSVYISEAPGGIVVDQTPLAGDRVKKNRKIFFTINAWGQEQIVVPDLIDNSLRNAQVYLESLGFTIGDLIYIPSEYTNLVLGQHHKGKPVEPGTQLYKGATIDLLVGRGLSNETTVVPNLVGMTVQEARRVAQSVYLNLGATISDDNIDSLSAFIWRQNPPSDRGDVLNLGASIDVWITNDYSLHPDSISTFQEAESGNEEPGAIKDAIEEEFF